MMASEHHADPNSRNDDTDRQAIAADSYHIGESQGDLVVALCVLRLPCDVGMFLAKDEALEFLGRLTFEIRQKGWLT